MMFSSNQVLSVSGSLNSSELENALEFGMKAAGKNLEEDFVCSFQITKDKKYCIGWTTVNNEAPEGWDKMPFNYNTKIVAEIIRQHLTPQTLDYDEYFDGSYREGFLMEVIPLNLGNELNNIKNPFYGYLSFKPFTCMYAK